MSFLSFHSLELHFSFFIFQGFHRHYQLDYILCPEPLASTQ